MVTLTKKSTKCLGGLPLLNKPHSHELSVIGANWYVDKSAFIRKSQIFLRLIDGRASIRCFFISMKDVKSLPPDDQGVQVAYQWKPATGAFLDISAYMDGAKSLDRASKCYLIFNDTLFTKHPWKLIGRRLSTMRESISEFPHPAAAGIVHPTTGLLLLDQSNPTRQHLSTFCMMLNAAGYELFVDHLNRLPNSNNRDEVEEWIAEKIDTYPAIRALLHVHLLGPRTIWSWKLHGSNLFQRKAVTVIFEYLFSVDLVRQGFAMPVNYDIMFKLSARASRLRMFRLQ